MVMLLCLLAGSPCAALGSSPADTGPGSALTDLSPILDQVSVESLWSTIDSLSACPTRRCGTPENSHAADVLRTRALDLGYADAAFDSFWCSATGSIERNIVFTKPGITAPDERVIIGAHFDCIASDSLTARAPGADDNASGVAGLLEIARIVRDLPLERTVTFALWNAEEISFLGSQHFVEEMSAQGLDAVLYVNLDCLAYTDGSWQAEVQTEDPGLRRAVSDLMREYTGISPTAAAPRSDWVPFWLAGVPTLYVCEDPVNPRVNGPTDSLHYLDSAYARDMTRADLVAMLGAAKLQGYDWPIAPWTVLLPTCATEAPGLPPGASVAVRWEGQDFDGSVAGYEYRVIAPTGADTSYHFVPASIESISFTAVAEGLYAVSVRAVDDDGLRDPDPASAIVPVGTLYGYPLLHVTSDVGGSARFRAQFCTEAEFPDTLFAGEHLSIRWRADASRYCSGIVGYQWAWDDTAAWYPPSSAPEETLLTVDLEAGEHRLCIRAIDDLG